MPCAFMRFGDRSEKSALRKGHRLNPHKEVTVINQDIGGVGIGRVVGTQTL